MTQHQDIQSIAERLNRMLDGMTVNKEVLVRDVRAVLREVVLRRTTEIKVESTNKQSSFSDAFRDLFKE